MGDVEGGESRILYSHYMKPVATRAVIDARSCHSDSMKDNVMVNEVSRILRNCSKRLEWNEVAACVTYFMRRMQYSGYSHEFRHKVLVGALHRYDRKIARLRTVEAADLGQTRNRRQINTRDDGSKKQKWYSAGGKFESVMFVEPTPLLNLRGEYSTS